MGNMTSTPGPVRKSRREVGDGMIMVEAAHLGGYIEGGDPWTFCPELWRWLVEKEGVKSVIDVGCGDGVAVRHFGELGCSVVGIDGVPQDDPRIKQHDYTKAPYLPMTLGENGEPQMMNVDLVWSCEFVEHVRERYLPHFVATFLTGRIVAMTHAEPDQGGYHHVNCRTSEYWCGVMATAGFQRDEALTATGRLLCQEPNHFARSGLIFRKLTPA